MMHVFTFKKPTNKCAGTKEWENGEDLLDEEEMSVQADETKIRENHLSNINEPKKQTTTYFCG